MSCFSAIKASVQQYLRKRFFIPEDIGKSLWVCSKISGTMNKRKSMRRWTKFWIPTTLSKLWMKFIAALWASSSANICEIMGAQCLRCFHMLLVTVFLYHISGAANDDEELVSLKCTIICFWWSVLVYTFLLNLSKKVDQLRHRSFHECSARLGSMETSFRYLRC